MRELVRSAEWNAAFGRVAESRGNHPMYGESRAWLRDMYRKRIAMFLLLAHHQKFRKEFSLDWLARNWHVWIAFEYHADMVWEAGRRRYSSRTIGEYMRHETLIREGAESEFKLNNNYFPDLARLYELMHPDRVDFFEKRVHPLSVRAA